MRYLPGRPFPAYAFLPGRDPHPTRDPSGHSYDGENEGPAEYFEPEPGGRGFRVRVERLPRIRFQVRDAMSQSFLRDLDLVFCRNLLIYIEPGLQENLLATLARALRPGGVLVLGRVERLLGDTRQAFQAVDASQRVYRKLAPGAQHAT